MADYRCYLLDRSGSILGNHTTYPATTIRPRSRGRGISCWTRADLRSGGASRTTIPQQSRSPILLPIVPSAPLLAPSGGRSTFHLGSSTAVIQHEAA